MQLLPATPLQYCYGNRWVQPDEHDNVVSLTFGDVDRSSTILASSLQSDGSWLILLDTGDLIRTRDVQTLWSSNERELETIQNGEHVAKKAKQSIVVTTVNVGEVCLCASPNPHSPGITYAVRKVRSNASTIVVGTTADGLNSEECVHLDSDPTCILRIQPDMTVLGLSNGLLVDSKSSTLLANLGSPLVGILIHSKIILALAQNGRVTFYVNGKWTQVVNSSLPGPVASACLLNSSNLVHCTPNGSLYLTEMNPRDARTNWFSDSQKIYVTAGRVRTVHRVSTTSVLLRFNDDSWCVYSLSDRPPLCTVQTSMDQLLQTIRREEVDDSLFVEERRLIARENEARLGVTLRNEQVRCAVSISSRGCDLRFLLSYQLLLVAKEISLPTIKLIIQLEQADKKETIARSLYGKQQLEFSPSKSFLDNSARSLLPLSVIVTSYVTFEDGTGVSKIVCQTEFDALDTGFIQDSNRVATSAPNETFKIARLSRDDDLPGLTSNNNLAGTIMRAILPDYWPVIDHSPFKASASAPDLRIQLEVDGSNVELAITTNDPLVASITRSSLLKRMYKQQLIKRETLQPRLSLPTKRTIATMNHQLASIQDSSVDIVSTLQASESFARATVNSWQFIRKNALA